MPMYGECLTNEQQLKYKNMKNLKNAAKYSLYILLATFLFACEAVSIPNAPFRVAKIDTCDGCAAKYKYKIKSIKNPKRYTQILSNEKYHIGDTLRFRK